MKGNTNISINELLRRVKLRVNKNTYRFKVDSLKGVRLIAKALRMDDLDTCHGPTPDSGSALHVGTKKTKHYLPKHTGSRKQKASIYGSSIRATLSMNRQPFKSVVIDVNQSDKQKITYQDEGGTHHTIQLFKSMYRYIHYNCQKKW